MPNVLPLKRRSNVREQGPACHHGSSLVIQSRASPDVAGLERELQDSIEGEVRFDAGSRALYATDGSNYRQVPIGVVVPKSKEDVERTVAVSESLAHQFFPAEGEPALPVNAATSL